MTKNGYIDSSRRIRSLHRQQDDMLVLATHPARGGLLAPINKSSLSSSPTTAKKSKPIAESPSAIAISANLESKKKEHEKHMRLIEVRSLPSRSLYRTVLFTQEQMIKAKQSEREVKRSEGDVKKEQRHLHHTLKDLDVGRCRFAQLQPCSMSTISLSP